MARVALALGLLSLACAGGGPSSPKGGVGDGAPEGGAPDAPDRAVPASGYAQFWLERAAIVAPREASCFRTVEVRPPPPAAVTAALAEGRLRFEPARAPACLASLLARSCAERLRELGDDGPACAGVLEGLVAPGDACALDLECRDPSRFACVHGPGGCEARCRARLETGADCAADRCLPGAFCRLLRAEGAPARFRCEALPLDGQPCDGDCAAGLFCSREGYDGFEGIDGGSCRPRVADGACRNDWQCPLPLFCMRDAGAVTGKCAPPRAGPGATCEPGRDDCGPGLACLPHDQGFSCMAGPRAGGACGYLEVGPGKSEPVGCAAGFCDLSAGIRRGICVDARGAGAPCRDAVECGAGLVCLPVTGRATCQAPPGAPVGSRCDVWNRCAPGSGCQAGACAPTACRDAGGERGVVAGLSAPGTFRLALVHGPASRQPTPLGRRIATLEPWQGRLYVGYGDYDGNTGPVSVSSFDPVGGALSEELTFDSEALAIYRPIGERLFAPAIDPRGSGPAFAVGAPWSQVPAFAATHVFDLAGVGGDLWAAGAQGMDAVVWRSRDGGGQWAESLREASTGGAFFMRYYFAGALGGKLYVQAVPSETGQARVFEGGAWTPGPNLLPLGGQGWNPRPFRDALVYLSWQPIGPQGGTLLVFDGTTVRPALSEEVLDFAVLSDGVYALGLDGRVQRSLDLAHWWTLGFAPTGARSLAVLAGRLYLGGIDGRVFVLEDAP